MPQTYVGRGGKSVAPIFNSPIFERRIISLYDMQQFFPDQFITAQLTITGIIRNYQKMEKEGLLNHRAATDADSLLLIRDLANDCERSRMILSSDLARKLADDLEAQRIKVIESLEGFRQLGGLIQLEMKRCEFYQLSNDEAALYNQEHPFGPVIGSKFPAIERDIREAARSLSLDRGTACVFHLMRAMESVTQQLGGKLRVKITKHKKPVKLSDAAWDEITVAILNKITLTNPSGATPSERRREKRYASIAQSLRNLKDAYRNPVAHPHVFFEVDEAGVIFNRCKHFLHSAAPLF